MRRILLAAVIFVTLAIVGIVTPQPESPMDEELPLKIRFPKDKTYVTQETIKIIGIVSDVSIQEVNLQVAGTEAVITDRVQVVNDAFEATVKLQTGLNEISVFPSGKEDAGTRIELFLKTGANAGEVPSDFEAYFLHDPIDEKTACQDCHKLNSTPADYRQMNIMGATCQTEACHENIGKQKYVHGPAAGGTCIACHNPHGSVNKHHASRSGAALCLICHEDKADELEQGHVHGVITMSGCTDCHDSHESPNKFQLQASTTRELCFTCHDDAKVKQQYVHGPVAAGDCNVCHNPHASPNKFQLVQTGNDLCFLCHDIIHEETALPIVHKPVKEACANCHNSHGSSNRKLLKKAEGILCFDCHKKTQEEIQTVAVQHKPVAEGNCMKCHLPHASDETKLLQTTTKQLCFTCHKQLGQVVSESKYRHGPVEENDR